MPGVRTARVPIGVAGGTLLAVSLLAGGCSSRDGQEPPRAGEAVGGKPAPRWERVGQFTGVGDQRSPPFDVAGGALQWRVTVTCGGQGRVRVRVPASEDDLAEVACPGKGFGFSGSTGANVVDVVAEESWELVVDQQVETAIAEPALPGMVPEAELASGSFSGIDQKGAGTATLYRLPDGGRALRLDPFSVTANTDLFVWVSAAEAPRTSAEAFGAPHTQVAGLKSTAGAQNYVLPADVPEAHLRSVVVWCEPVRTAYAAAPLDG